MQLPSGCLALSTVIALVCIGAQPAEGQVARWSRLGPSGGTVWSIAVAPGNPNVVYAGTGAAGLFKSTDAGLTWGPNQALGEKGVFQIVIDPLNQQTVYAFV